MNDLSYEVKSQEETRTIFRGDCSDLRVFLTKDLKIVPHKCLVVTDSNLNPVLFKKIKSQLEIDGFKIFSLIFNRSLTTDEEIKSYSSTKLVYNILLNNHFDRSNILIALGGGVIGDLSGFCAATFHRGITLIQYPTSLLAQIDSSIGGKNGLHYNGITNLIGTYYQPKGVYIDFSTLDTLPYSEYLNGLAEIIKIALITDKEFAEFLDKNSAKIIKKKAKIVRKVIWKAVKLKSDIISKDVKENRERLFLNYGHTIGQATETLFKHNKIKHGEAVVLGMVGASYIGSLLGMTDKKFIDFQENILKKFEFLNNIKKKIVLKKSEISRLSIKTYKYIFFDKKKRGKIPRFIIPETVGRGRIVEIKDQTVIKKSIKKLFSLFLD